jgi:hypothetical protein
MMLSCVSEWWWELWFINKRGSPFHITIHYYISNYTYIYMYIFHKYWIWYVMNKKKICFRFCLYLWSEEIFLKKNLSWTFIFHTNASCDKLLTICELGAKLRLIQMNTLSDLTIYFLDLFNNQNEFKKWIVTAYIWNQVKYFERLN